MVCIVGTGEADSIFADTNSKSSVTEAPFNSYKCHRQWAEGIRHQILHISTEINQVI